MRLTTPRPIFFPTPPILQGGGRFVHSRSADDYDPALVARIYRTYLMPEGDRKSVV